MAPGDNVTSPVKSMQNITRRSFLAASAMAPLALSAASYKNIPVGLELYSVRGEMAKDLPATVTAVAKMGYQVVEFFAPYYRLDRGLRQTGPQAPRRPRHPLQFHPQRSAVVLRGRHAEGHRPEQDSGRQIHRDGERREA
jgi:hypothetical protein